MMIVSGLLVRVTYNVYNYRSVYADAFAAALAIGKKATLITGDHQFEALT